MKTTLTLAAILILMSGCVQKAYKRILIVTVDVSKIKHIKSVGIRGSGSPLSWETDYPMKEIVKDSLYKATIVTITGYSFTEAKCTVNGNFELQDKPNRRIYFETKKDSTAVNLVFDRD